MAAAGAVLLLDSPDTASTDPLLFHLMLLTCMPVFMTKHVSSSSSFMS